MDALDARDRLQPEVDVFAFPDRRLDDDMRDDEKDVVLENELDALSEDQQQSDGSDDESAASEFVPTTRPVMTAAARTLSAHTLTRLAPNATTSTNS
jgi:hypothetical protein